MIKVGRRGKARFIVRVIDHYTWKSKNFVVDGDISLEELARVVRNAVEKLAKEGA